MFKVGNRVKINNFLFLPSPYEVMGVVEVRKNVVLILVRHTVLTNQFDIVQKETKFMTVRGVVYANADDCEKIES